MDPSPYVAHLKARHPFAVGVARAFRQAWKTRGCYPLAEFNRFQGTTREDHDPSCLAWVGFFGLRSDRSSVELVPIPVINFSNRYGMLPGCVNVLVDDEAIGALAADHLHEKGFRDFAFIGHTTHVYGIERAAGFRKRLEALGQSPQILYLDELDPADNPLEARNKAREWVAHFLHGLSGPVGILAANDDIAQFFLGLAQENLPERLPWLGVVGVDNRPAAQGSEKWGAFTTVEPPYEAVGQTLARTLAEAIESGIKATTVIRVGGARLIERATTGAPVSGDLFFARLTRRIHEEIEKGNRSSVEDLAKSFGVTPRALLARFSRKTDQSLRDYILHTRLRRAAALLTDTSMSIADVAYASGFSKHAALTEHFGKAYGMTPSAYRAEHRRS